MIRYPHIKYAAYLQYRKLDLECSLPWPTLHELSFWMTKIPSRKNPAWVKRHKLSALNTQPGQVAFDCWWHDRIRNYLTVALLRNVPEAQIFAVMKSVFRVKSEKFLAVYKNIFFDIEDWDISDLESYNDKLEGTDFRIFRLACSDVSSSLVFKEMDIQVEDVEYNSMLKDILTTSYTKWKKNTSDIKLVKSILRVGKELREVSGAGTDILEELKSDLEKPPMEHRKFTIEELIERQQRDIREQAPTEEQSDQQ